MRILFALAVVVALFGVPKTAEAASGMAVFHDCSDPSLDVVCHAYIDGALSGLILGQQLGLNKQTVCIPPNITWQQVHIMFDQEASKHPENLNNNAMGLIGGLMMAYYQCAPGQSPQ